MKSNLLDLCNPTPINSVYKDFFLRKLCNGMKKCSLSKGIVPDFLLETFECAKEDKLLLYSSDLQDTPAYQSRFCPDKPYEHIAFIVKEDGGILLINTELSGPQSIIQNFRGHSNCIFDAQWMGRNHLLTCSGDLSIKYHDLVTEQMVSQFKSHTGSVKALTLRPNHNKIFASSSRDGSIMIWDLNNKSISINDNSGAVFFKSSNNIYNAHHPDINASTTFSKLSVRKKSSSNYNAVPKPVTSVIFATENILISSGASDGKIKLWDIRKINTKNPEPVKTISYSGKNLNSPGYTDLIVNRTGNTLFAYCKDGVIYQYNINNLDFNKPVFRYSGHLSDSYYLKIDLSPDENYIICGSSSNSPFIYHVGVVPQYPVLLNGHKGEVTVCRWCPSNQGVILTISDDCSAMVHRMRPGSSYNVFYRDQINRDKNPIGHHLAPLSLSSRSSKQTVNESNQFRTSNQLESISRITENNFALESPVVPMKTKNQSIKSFLSPVPSKKLFQNLSKPNIHFCQVLDEKTNIQQSKCGKPVTFTSNKPQKNTLLQISKKKKYDIADENNENQLLKRRKTLFTPITRFLNQENP